MSYKLRLMASATLILATGFSVNAQDAATKGEPEQIEKVVVTAQKRAQKLKDVPLPVQSISKSQIDNTGASAVADLVPQIPGASVVSKSTPGFETVQIRGISSGTTGDGLVGYYVDETPFGIPNLQLSPPGRLLDVSRVEVIRGPSGTLYGQGSMGGTIKVVTAKPDSTEMFGTIRGEISLTEGGETNTYTDIVVNLPIVKDELALRASGSLEKLSGYAEAPEFADRKNVNGFDGANVRFVAEWTPKSDLAITAMYWRIANAQDFNNGLTPGFPTSSPTISGTGGRRGFTDIDMDLYSATVNWTTSIGTLTANTSYIQHTLDFEAPLTLSGFAFNNDSTFETDS
ncbi:MAG: TonB-dependent receptor, partial [Alphaproteobacteria bacterium]